MRAVVIISLFILCGCATKKKAIEVRKTEVETFEQHSEIDSSATNLQIQSNFKGFEVSELSEIADLFKWTFTGENENDEFKLKVDKTEKGFEITAKGKGFATAEVNSSHSITQTVAGVELKIDSVTSSINTHQSLAEQRVKEFEKEKNINKESKGIQFGGYITIIIVSVAILLLLFIMWRMKLFRWFK